MAKGGRRGPRRSGGRAEAVGGRPAANAEARGQREAGGRGSFTRATRSRDGQADNWVRGELRADISHLDRRRGQGAPLGRSHRVPQPWGPQAR